MAMCTSQFDADNESVDSRRSQARIAVLLFSLCFLVSCAASPEVESRRLAREARISEILAQPDAAAELGPVKRCLSSNDYRRYSALDDRYLLFEGRRDKFWVSTLPRRCPDLRFGDVLVVRSFSSLRICDRDTFVTTEWFDWPWYRRWPWRWGTAWGTGMSCTLGKFQPVTAEQVDEIKSVLRSR